MTITTVLALSLTDGARFTYDSPFDATVYTVKGNARLVGHPFHSSDVLVTDTTGFVHDFGRFGLVRPSV